MMTAPLNISEPERRPSILRGARTQLVLLAIAMALAGYVRTATGPLQESIKLGMGLSDNQISFLQGAVVGLPIMLSAVPLGMAIDRFTRVILLRWLAIICLLANFATTAAPTYEALVVARGLAGVAALSIIPVILSLLADLFPASARGKAISAAMFGQVAGSSLAFALGGALLTAVGSEGDGWRSAMLWLTAISLPLVILLFCIAEPARKPREDSNAGADAPFDRVKLLLLACGVIAMETAVGAVLIWAAPTLAREFALAPSSIGVAMGAAMLVSGIFGPVAGGFLADQTYKRGGVRFACLALGGLSLLCVPLALYTLPASPAVAIALLIASITMMLATAVFGITLFTIIAPAHRLGLFNSILMAGVLFSALAIAPFAVSLLAGRIGGDAQIGVAMSLVCVGASLLSAICFGLGGMTRSPHDMKRQDR